MNGPMTNVPFSSWPKDDQERWTDAANPGTFAEDGVSLGVWSRRHQGLARYAYGMWLAFLQQHFPTALCDSPEARATPDRVRQFAHEALGRLHPSTVAVAVVNLKGVFESLSP